MFRKFFGLGKTSRKRFYNRIMLYNTIIFMVVAYAFAYIAVDYSKQLETMKQLQENRDALSAICSYYDSKHNEFINLLFPLYEETKNYSAISRFLESESDREFMGDPYAKEEMVNVLRGITIRDPDIIAIFIYKNLTDKFYVYDNNQRTFEYADTESVFYKLIKEKNKGRSIFGSQNYGSKRSASIVYGIAGTMGTRNIRQDAGSIAIAYDTRAIERVLQEYSGKIKGRFLLITIDGDVIFDSQSRYDEDKFPHMDILLQDNGSINIEGELYYVQTIPMLNRRYIGAHIIPKKQINMSSSRFPSFIYSIFSAIVIISGALYLISGYIASRRVGEVIKGMKKIGSHNLSYRIPLRSKKDEFEEIALRFNEMCDELQETIKRVYINEIKKKNAELDALQAGINPHFLFNTLEAIRIKAVDEKKIDIAEMIVLLANLYRSIVREQNFITIRKEINTCSMYLNIFSLRYANKLNYEINLEPEIMSFGIPKNMLQPILENYFLYGIRNDWSENYFEISGRLEQGDIVFCLKDNGRGIDSARLEEIRKRLESAETDDKSSYGLANVHSRIKLVYGEPYGLWIDSQKDSGTQVVLRIKALTCDELKQFQA